MLAEHAVRSSAAVHIARAFPHTVEHNKVIASKSCTWSEGMEDDDLCVCWAHTGEGGHLCVLYPSVYQPVSLTQLALFFCGFCIIFLLLCYEAL